MALLGGSWDLVLKALKGSVRGFYKGTVGILGGSWDLVQLYVP